MQFLCFVKLVKREAFLDGSIQDLICSEQDDATYAWGSESNKSSDEPHLPFQRAIQNCLAVKSGGARENVTDKKNNFLCFSGCLSDFDRPALRCSSSNVVIHREASE